MRPTIPVILVVLAVAVGAITWAVLGLTYVSLPPMPWTAVPTLLLLAVGEATTGFNIRGRLQRRPDTKPVEPLVMVRMAALGKASAHAAAVLVGVFGGFVGYLGSSLDKPTPRRDFFVSTGTFLAALVLVGAALFLEYACRVPKRPEDEDSRRS